MTQKTTSAPGPESSTRPSRRRRPTPLKRRRRPIGRLPGPRHGCAGGQPDQGSELSAKRRRRELMATSEGRSAAESTMLDVRRIGKTILGSREQLWVGSNPRDTAVERLYRSLQTGHQALPWRRKRSPSSSRFRQASGRNDLVFDLLKQSYLIASQWLAQQVSGDAGHRRAYAEPTSTFVSWPTPSRPRTSC